MAPHQRAAVSSSLSVIFSVRWWLSRGDFSPPGGTVAVPASWGCSWCLLGGGQDAAEPPLCLGRPHSRDDRAQIHRGQDSEACSRLDSSLGLWCYSSHLPLHGAQFQLLGCLAFWFPPALEIDPSCGAEGRGWLAKCPPGPLVVLRPEPLRGCLVCDPHQGLRPPPPPELLPGAALDLATSL